MAGRQNNADAAASQEGDEIADTGLVVLVVDLDLLGATEDLAVQGVLVALLDEDDNRLVHLVGDDVAATHLALGALGGLLDVLGAGLLAHLDSSVLGAVRIPSSRSRTIV